MTLPEWIAVPDWVGNIVWFLIYSALTVDGFRAVIAMLGIVPRNKCKWLSRLIYGKYDRTVLYDALHDLGYKQRDAHAIVTNFEKNAVVIRPTSGVNNKNVTAYILSALANYIQEYPRQIQYGGRTPSNSVYYIDTMEAVHNNETLRVMVDAIITLISKYLQEEKPDVIFTPKGGNPIFAKAVADSLGAKLVVVKSMADKSRVTLSTPNEREKLLLFRSNYEGSWSVASHVEKKQLGIVVDCNVSGGSQLCDIARDINELIDAGILNMNKINHMFALFRADMRHKDIDKRFEDLGLVLHRYFDLSEKNKRFLYQLHETKPEGECVDIYSPADMEEIKKILESLKENNNLYWSL